MGHCRHSNSRSRVRSSRRPSRGARVRVLIAVGAGLLLAACSAPAQPEGPPEIPEGVTGLAVRVSGLPVGEPAAVRVLREGITIAELDGSANLENIDVGTYSIEADDIGCLEPIQKQLKPGGNGRIKFVVAREQGRKLYEIDIGANWQINPALAGAIKSFDGVVDVRLN